MLCEALVPVQYSRPWDTLLPGRQFRCPTAKSLPSTCCNQYISGNVGAIYCSFDCFCSIRLFPVSAIHNTSDVKMTSSCCSAANIGGPRAAMIGGSRPESINGLCANPFSEPRVIYLGGHCASSVGDSLLLSRGLKSLLYTKSFGKSKLSFSARADSNRFESLQNFLILYAFRAPSSVTGVRSRGEANGAVGNSVKYHSFVSLST